MGAMLYAIETEGRSIFYGTDTATLFEQTWQAFRQYKMRFDIVILDHTYGPDQPGSDHLSAHQVIEHANRMRAEGGWALIPASLRPILPMKVIRHTPT